MDVKQSHLESIVEQIGEAVLATTETIDHLAVRMDALAIQVQQQSHQIQQQGYQIFALSDAVQALADTQNRTLERLDTLTSTMQRLMNSVEDGNP